MRTCHILAFGSHSSSHPLRARRLRTYLQILQGVTGGNRYAVRTRYAPLRAREIVRTKHEPCGLATVNGKPGCGTSTRSVRAPYAREEVALAVERMLPDAILYTAPEGVRIDSIWAISSNS